MPKTRLTAAYLSRGRWTISDARAALSAQESSGLSVAAFAAREGVNVQRLYGWRRRLAAAGDGADGAPGFVELCPCGAEPVEIVLRSGRVVRVAETVDPSALVRIVTALECEPC